MAAASGLSETMILDDDSGAHEGSDDDNGDDGYGIESHGEQAAIARQVRLLLDLDRLGQIIARNRSNSADRCLACARDRPSMVGTTINRRDMNHSERNYEIQQLETSRHEAAKAVCLSAAALNDASITRALNHINDERDAAQERPVTLQCLADAGMRIMWEPRLVVVQDAGTPNGIDCGIVQAFEEAVWHKLTASKAAHRERWQAMMNEVRQLEQECKDLQKLKQYLAGNEDDRVCQACTAHEINAVVCWSSVLSRDMMVDNAVCRGLKVQRELDADVFLRCVRDDKHHRYVHMLHRHRNDGTGTSEAFAVQQHGVCMRESNVLGLSESKKYMDTLIQPHRAKMQERKALCAQMKRRNQQYFKLDNEAENKQFDRVFRRVSTRCKMQQQRSNPEARQEEQSHDTRRRGRKRKTDPDRADADREQDRLSKKKMRADSAKRNKKRYKDKQAKRIKRRERRGPLHSGNDVLDYNPIHTTFQKEDETVNEYVFRRNAEALNLSAAPSAMELEDADQVPNIALHKFYKIAGLRSRHGADVPHTGDLVLYGIDVMTLNSWRGAEGVFERRQQIRIIHRELRRLTVAVNLAQSVLEADGELMKHRAEDADGDGAANDMEDSGDPSLEAGAEDHATADMFMSEQERDVVDCLKSSSRDVISDALQRCRCDLQSYAAKSQEEFEAWKREQRKHVCEEEPTQDSLIALGALFQSS